MLSGWSYGPLVLPHYIRHYGEERLGGSSSSQAVTKLGSAEAAPLLSPEFLNLASVVLLNGRRDECPRVGWLAAAVFNCCRFVSHAGYNVSVPPFVRQGMLSRSSTTTAAADPQAGVDYRRRR